MDPQDMEALLWQTTEALWQLLDDIDTSSDQIKPSDIFGYIRFYRRALDIAQRRHALLKSDGYKLMWPGHLDMPHGEEPHMVRLDSVLTRALAEPTLVDALSFATLTIARALRGASWQPTLKTVFTRVLDGWQQEHDVLPSTPQREKAPQEPIPMLLWCPACHERHIDHGEFATTRTHRDHSCQSCGLTWRPALVPTVGVQFLPGYKDVT